MNLKPTFNRLILKAITEDETSTGGIVIPEQYRSANVKLKRGTVAAMGPGREREDGSFRPIGLEMGNVVWYDLLNSLPFEQDGNEYCMIDYINALAIEKQEQPTGNIIPIQ